MTTLFIIACGLWLLGWIFDDELEALCKILSIICFVIWVICFIFSKTENKEDKQEAVVADSTVVVKKDSIEKMIFVVSWKDEDGVWAGQNVKLIGKTEKNIGDTIIINLN